MDPRNSRMLNKCCSRCLADIRNSGRTGRAGGQRKGTDVSGQGQPRLSSLKKLLSGSSVEALVHIAVTLSLWKWVPIVPIL